MDILNENFKDLFFYLKNMKASSFINSLINNWMISLFTNNISEKFQLIIWDLFLLEGYIILFKASYALIKIISKDIFSVKKFELFQNFFSNVVPKYDNSAKLIYFLSIKKYSFNHFYIKNKRRELFKQTLNNISKKETYQNHNESEDLITKCDLDWPICIKNKNFKNQIFEFIVYKTLIPPIIKNNYYFNTINYYNNTNEENQKEEIYNTILIERHKHICNSELHSIRDLINEKNNSIIEDNIK